MIGIQRFSAAALLMLCAFGARAHRTGHEARTAADCENLPGTSAKGERGACLRCVHRPRKHHFHPEYQPGKRCRPNNGRP